MRATAPLRRLALPLAGCAALALWAGPLRAQEGPQLALTGVRAQQLEASERRELERRLRERAIAARRFSVLPRALSELRLAESPVAENGRCRGPCADRARDVLGASLLLGAQVERAGKRCQLVVELTDSINEGASRKGEAAGGCGREQLVASLDAALGQVLSPARPAGPALPEPAPAPEPQPSTSAALFGGGPAAKASGRVRVSPAEKGVPAAAVGAVRKALLKAGLELADEGGKADWQVRVRAEVRSVPVIGGTALIPRVATLSWELLPAGGGRIAATGSNTGKRAHIDEVQGGQLALEQAGAAAADEIAQAIARGGR